jgi:hypothetical protein
MDVCGASRREIPSGNVISRKILLQAQMSFHKSLPHGEDAKSKTASLASGIQRTHGNSLTLTFPRLNCFAGLAPFLILSLSLLPLFGFAMMGK